MAKPKLKVTYTIPHHVRLEHFIFALKERANANFTAFHPLTDELEMDEAFLEIGDDLQEALINFRQIQFDRSATYADPNAGKN